MNAYDNGCAEIPNHAGGRQRSHLVVSTYLTVDWFTRPFVRGWYSVEFRLFGQRCLVSVEIKILMTCVILSAMINDGVHYGIKETCRNVQATAVVLIRAVKIEPVRLECFSLKNTKR